MKVDFDTIHEHIIPLDNFQLKWRFTEEEYNKLPDQHLELLRPLSKAAAKFLSDYIDMIDLHGDIPFKKGFFRTAHSIEVLTDNEKEIKKWLYQRGLPFDQLVFLTWSQEDAMIVPWEIFIKYFDSFYYPIADDLTVFDQSLTWALLFFHEHEIHFGTNEHFTPSPTNWREFSAA
ncbi:hypothetical protein [Hymenobacter swuensis]|uniref:Uncharacterized protein n=1 Tax=Hymenobacter swuensis DY53 TaxID=1227739 RepID=W8F0B4_9BACT|nr:hypothetical protein [Hymenobacter swuensis]AHJ96006.1 hypothetical protein Hsw_0411 [Hymenobacter swuensis DY53]